MSTARTVSASRTIRRPRRSAALAALVAVGLGSWFTGSASAVTAVVVVRPGTLQFLTGTPSGISFAPVTLNGTDTQVTTGTMAFDISDATGSAAGWSVQATSTPFTDGAGHALPNDATTIVSQPSPTCDGGSSCVVAAVNVQYPYTLPAGPGATATVLFDAQPGSGLGNETFVPTFRLTLPGSVVAASYSAIWTFSLVSGP
jgi:hypothetical protein